MLGVSGDPAACSPRLPASSAVPPLTTANARRGRSRGLLRSAGRPVPRTASVLFGMGVLFEAMGVVAGQIDLRVIKCDLSLIGAPGARALRWRRKQGWGRRRWAALELIASTHGLPPGAVAPGPGAATHAPPAGPERGRRGAAARGRAGQGAGLVGAR